MKPSVTRLQHASVLSAAKLVQHGSAMIFHFRTFLSTGRAMGWSVPGTNHGGISHVTANSRTARAISPRAHKPFLPRGDTVNRKIFVLEILYYVWEIFVLNNFRRQQPLTVHINVLRSIFTHLIFVARTDY